MRECKARWRGDCSTLEVLGLWDQRNCCSSCHEDAEDFGNDYPLMEMTLPTGRGYFDNDYVEVCCRVDRDEAFAAKVLKALEEAHL